MTEKKLTAIEMLKINIRGIKLCNSLIPWNSFLTFLLITLQILVEYWPCIFFVFLLLLGGRLTPPGPFLV